MSPHIFLVAGEESGDRLGAALIAAIRQHTKGQAQFSCVGGSHMAAAGVPSLFPLGDLAIIGFASIPASLPKILRRIREAADAVVSAKPDALIIIDSPEFTHRVAQRVRARRRQFRLSTMSVLQCGRGGRGVHGPCELISITCWRCCRSNLRSWRSLVVRPALMSVTL